MGHMGIDEPLLYQKLGAELKRLRKSVPLSQEKLAKDIGVERTSITNIECGRQKAPLHLLYQLCQALGVDLVDVLPRNADVSKAEAEQDPMVVVEDGIKMPPRAAEFFKEIQKK